MNVSNVTTTPTPEHMISPNRCLMPGTVLRSSLSSVSLDHGEPSASLEASCSVKPRNHYNSIAERSMKSLDLSHLPDDEFFLIPPSALPRPSSSFFISYEAPSEDDLDAMEMETITSSFQPSEDTTFQFISSTRRNRSRIIMMGNEGDAAQSTSRRTVSSRFQIQSLLISFVTMDIYSPTTTPSPEHKISPAARPLTPTPTVLHSLPPPVRRGRDRPSCSVESRKDYSCSIAELFKALDLSHVPDDELFLLPPNDLPQPPFAFFTSEDPSSDDDDDDAKEMEAITSSFISSVDTSFRSISSATSRTQDNWSRSITLRGEDDALSPSSPPSVPSRFQTPRLLLRPRSCNAPAPWQTVNSTSTW